MWPSQVPFLKEVGFHFSMLHPSHSLAISRNLSLHLCAFQLGFALISICFSKGEAFELRNGSEETKMAPCRLGLSVLRISFLPNLPKIILIWLDTPC